MEGALFVHRHCRCIQTPTSELPLSPPSHGNTGRSGRGPFPKQRLLLSSIDLRNIYILVIIYDKSIYDATPEPPIALGSVQNQLAERVCLSFPIAWQTSLKETLLSQITPMSTA